MHAFIFDFDGVIVDSEKWWDEHAYRLHNEMIPAFTEDDDAYLKGRNVHDIYNWLKETFGITFSKEEYLETVGSFAEDIYKNHVNLIPGIDRLIQTLQEQQMPIAIASSGEREWILLALETMNMQDTFEHIVTATDVGIGKPDPAVYIEAAKRLGVDPADCIALEDSTNGIRAAKAAGMTCYALKHNWGYSQDLSEADWVVESVEEITKSFLAS